jgi:hypothetical protein
MTDDDIFWPKGTVVPIPDPNDIDPAFGDPGVDECERTLLRDIARLHGTRPAVLALAEAFILGWLEANPEHGCCAYIDPVPEEFLAAYQVWQTALPRDQRLDSLRPHQLYDPIDMLFWDLAGLDEPFRPHPPADLHEAVLFDVFACERELQWAVSAIWKRRYPEADHAQWVEWYAMTRAFHRGVKDKVP